MDASPPKHCRTANWLIVALLILCVTLPLTSCSKKASTAIIGKWQVQSSQETVEFRKDGTLITTRDTTAGPPGNTRAVTQETTGKYTFTDANHMNVEINTGDTNQPAISASCDVRIDGNKMRITTTLSGGRQTQQTSFKRVR